jgi:hypothetical protein
MLLDFVSKYIIRPHSSVAPHITDAPILTLTHSPELDIVHQIFCQMLLHDPDLVARSVDPAFAQSLVQQLTSSTKGEQPHLRKEIGQIASICTDLTPTITSALLTLVTTSVHDHRAVPGLPAAVALLVPLLQNPMSCRAYRRSIVPLYALKSFLSFAEPLREITRCFAMWSASNADHWLDYVMGHWPLTNGRKEAAFLSEVTALFDHFSDQGLARNRRRLLAHATRAIASRHALVAEGAARVLMRDPHGRGPLSAHQPITPALASAIRAAREHWDVNVQKAAAALDFVIAQRPTATATAEKQRRATWGHIRRRVHSARRCV